MVEFKNINWRNVFVGSYDYKFLCTPRWNPWAKGANKPPQLFRKDEILSILVAAIMGLQHAIAMVGGLITPPILVYSSFLVASFKGPDGKPLAPYSQDKAAYMVSASMIVCGILTIMQCSHIRIPYTNIHIGSGLLSVMGTAFTYLPIAQASLGLMAAQGGLTWEQAYGKLLGTFMICALIEIGLCLLPPRVLRRIFPSFASGVTVILLGVGLTASGFKYWGGGAFCADTYLVPGRTCCGDNGGCKFLNPNFNGVSLPYGDPVYMGMGLTVVAFLIFIELFGSPFMRNCNVVLALLFGCFISGVVGVTRNGNTMRFWSDAKINATRDGFFLWVYSFPLGVYGPAFFPTIIAYFVTTVETIGDITATEEASEEPMKGNAHNRHVQGALMGDAISSVFAGLGTVMPNTTFSQNNGVIAMTRCASRSAGYACGIWLITWGVIGKFGAFFSNIPHCVLGGMTTFLFANVSVSGIKIMAASEITRRTRFISALALGVGFGVSCVPHWFNSTNALAANNLWKLTPDMSPGVRGLRDGVLIFITTGYCIGAAIALLLNLIIPLDEAAIADLDATFDKEPSEEDAQKAATTTAAPHPGATSI